MGRMFFLQFGFFCVDYIDCSIRVVIAWLLVYALLEYLNKEIMNTLQLSPID